SRNQSVLSRLPKRILYTGAVSPHKGLHALLDSFNIVVRQYPDVQLDVVGFQGSYPLAENFEFSDRELMERILPFYTYNWAKLKARLSLATPGNWAKLAKLSLTTPGAGSYLADLKQKVSLEASGKVAFHGFVPRTELVDFYYSADVFAFTPIW